jgi:organic hydroperoxide reductase OsmC/OhrA
MAEDNTFSLTLVRLENYEFETKFDLENLPSILLDEPPPLGNNKGPNASRMLAAAVGDCLSASLLFCLEKSKVPIQGVQTDVRGTLVRNEKGRLQVGKLDVHIKIDVPGETPQRTSRCLELFEEYCIVTGSVRKGIPVNVTVTDSMGNELFHRYAEGE